MSFCQVGNCSQNMTHITREHVCEICGDKGHGIQECHNVNFNISESTLNSRVTTLPQSHYCRKPLCPNPHTHMTNYHNICYPVEVTLNILIQRSKINLQRCFSFEFFKENIEKIFKKKVAENNNRHMTIYTSRNLISEVIYARLKDIIHSNSGTKLIIEYILIDSANLNTNDISRDLSDVRNEFINNYEFLDYYKEMREMRAINSEERERTMNLRLNNNISNNDNLNNNNDNLNNNDENYENDEDNNEYNNEDNDEDINEDNQETIIDDLSSLENNNEDNEETIQENNNSENEDEDDDEENEDENNNSENEENNTRPQVYNSLRSYINNYNNYMEPVIRRHRNRIQNQININNQNNNSIDNSNINFIINNHLLQHHNSIRYNNIINNINNNEIINNYENNQEVNNNNEINETNENNQNNETNENNENNEDEDTDSDYDDMPPLEPISNTHDVELYGGSSNTRDTRSFIEDIYSDSESIFVKCPECRAENNILKSNAPVIGIETKECSVCLDAKATTYFPKCGHIVCCKECLDKLPRINRSNSSGLLTNRSTIRIFTGRSHNDWNNYNNLS